MRGLQDAAIRERDENFPAPRANHVIVRDDDDAGQSSELHEHARTPLDCLALGGRVVALRLHRIDRKRPMGSSALITA